MRGDKGIFAACLLLGVWLQVIYLLIVTTCVALRPCTGGVMSLHIKKHEILQRGLDEFNFLQKYKKYK